jgi:hypothetical protein
MRQTASPSVLHDAAPDLISRIIRNAWGTAGGQSTMTTLHLPDLNTLKRDQQSLLARAISIGVEFERLPPDSKKHLRPSCKLRPTTT